MVFGNGVKIYKPRAYSMCFQPILNQKTADATMYRNSNFVFVWSMKTPLKEIFSTAVQPKTSSNIKFCNIKTAHLVTFIYYDFDHNSIYINHQQAIHTTMFIFCQKHFLLEAIYHRSLPTYDKKVHQSRLVVRSGKKSPNQETALVWGIGGI